MLSAQGGPNLSLELGKQEPLTIPLAIEPLHNCVNNSARAREGERRGENEEEGERGRK